MKGNDCMSIIPSKDQYIQTIKNGDDSVHKKVILNLDGKFEVVKNSDFDIDSEYVGRSETLDAGNGYVGIAASEDNEYINSSYAMFLEGWLSHIKTGRKKMYLDVYPRKTPEQLLQEIEAFYKNKNKK